VRAGGVEPRHEDVFPARPLAQSATEVDTALRVAGESLLTDMMARP
jgi:hypothetical protein